jgi:hypothetical protein
MNARRRVLVFTLLAVIVVFGFVVRAWWQDQRAGLYARVATHLKQALSADPRFVTVSVRRNFDEVVVLAPDTLRTPDKAALQHIVTEESKPLDIRVLYLPALDAAVTPSAR